MANLPEENLIISEHIKFLFSIPCTEYHFDCNSDMVDE
jgi:hypothetical protein